MSLEEKKEHFESLLNQDEETMKNQTEDRLTKLKLEKPELFYITGEEQIAIILGHVLKHFLGCSDA